LLRNINEDEIPKKTYNKTPKPRKQSKIDEADNESQEITTDGNNSLQWAKEKIDTRHSLNHERSDYGEDD